MGKFEVLTPSVPNLLSILLVLSALEAWSHSHRIV